MTRPRQDQPRGLALHARLAAKLTALYATQASDRGSHGNGTGGGTPPIPVSAAVVDTRAWVERTLARLEAIVTGVLAGGDSVVPVSGWWGQILCPICGQDTLRLDLGARWVSCINREDCDEGTGQPFSESEGWLEGQALGERNDGGPTITQRQRQRIETLEGDVARWRDQATDWRALYEQAMTVMAAHGLTESQLTGVSSGHVLFVCPETGGEHAR